MQDVVAKSPEISRNIEGSLASTQLRSRSYRPDIDGLRSLAILSVVLYHAGVERISGGFTGVDVFFAISGYLIGGHILSELRTRAFRFSGFYRNRAKRILPALYVVLLGVLVIGLVLLSPLELRDLGKFTFFTTASTSNIMLWKTTGYFASNADLNPLLMTWSLGVEEQFYLIIPLILVLVARLRPRLIFSVIVLISVASFILAAYQVRHTPDSAFYLLGSRAWELGIGVAVAIFEVEGRKVPALQTPRVNELTAWAGLLLVLGPFFIFNKATAFPGAAALPSVVGGALLLSSSGAWVNRRLLSLPPLVYVGRVSYSFYLIHWPILAFLHVLAGRSLPLAWGLGAIAVAFGLAVLSYYFVERPFRSSPLKAGPLLWRYAAVSLLLLLVSGAIYKSHGIPSRYPLAATVDAAADADDGTSHDACLVKSGTNSPNLDPPCAASNPTGSGIALWGDSHASAIATALRAASARQGYFMEEYAKTACPPLHGVGRSYRSRPADLAGCIQFNDEVLHKLLAEPRIQVVVLVAYWDGAFDPSSVDQGRLARMGHDPAVGVSQSEAETLMNKSLTETLRALLEAHKKVVVFGDTPVFEVDPLWRLRTRAIEPRWKLSGMLNRGFDVDPGLDRAFDDTPSQVDGRMVVQRTVLSTPGARFWDARSRLCDVTDMCVYRQGRAPLFADANHLTLEGASLVIEGLNFRKL